MERLTCLELETSWPWIIGKVFMKAHRMVRNVGFLQKLGSLLRPFIWEAIFKCYLNSLKGPKCHNKQGIENTLLFLLMCANRASKDAPELAAWACCFRVG